MSTCCSNNPFCDCKKETILFIGSNHMEQWEKALGAMGINENPLQSKKELQHIGIIGGEPSIGAEIAPHLAMGDRGIVIHPVTPEEVKMLITNPYKDLPNLIVTRKPDPDEKHKRKHTTNYTPPKKKRKK